MHHNFSELMLNIRLMNEHVFIIELKKLSSIMKTNYSVLNTGILNLWTLKSFNVVDVEEKNYNLLLCHTSVILATLL